MRVLLFLYLLTSCYCGYPTNGGKPVEVKGLLLCNGKPARAFVEIREKEASSERRLIAMFTTSKGFFTLKGYAKDASQTWLNIYHTCSYKGAKTCFKKIQLKIPSKYYPYNIQALDLAKEHRDAKTIIECKI